MRMFSGKAVDLAVKVLTDKPETRNDSNLLIRTMYEEMGYNIADLGQNKKMPKYGTFDRAVRFARKEHPELKGNVQTEMARDENQKRIITANNYGIMEV